MNLVKIGGSILNPDGRYDEKLVQELIHTVKESQEKFIFVVGGGKLCRKIMEAAKPFLSESLKEEKKVNLANDEIGIAVTKINARYLLERFQEKLGPEVYPEILLNPKEKVKSEARVFLAGGWKPGHSTDKDMMLLAKRFKVPRAFKLTDFDYVKKVHPREIADLPYEKIKERLDRAESIPEMSWEKLKKLVGEKWSPGMNTPFDPQAAEMGCKLRKKLQLYFLRKEEFSKALKGEKFKGTVVRR